MQIYTVYILLSTMIFNTILDYVHYFKIISFNIG